MEKPLEPPPPVRNPGKAQDKSIARITHPSSQYPQELDPFANCTNSSERLEIMLDTLNPMQQTNFWNRH